MSHSNSKLTKGAAHAIKNAWAEPLAKKLGTKVGAFLLDQPSIVKHLDSASPNWRGMVATAVRGGGGVIQIPGEGPVIYIVNEAFDAFTSGLGDALEAFEGMSEEELANNASVRTAIDSADKKLESLLDSKVKVNLTEGAYHTESCVKAKGRSLSIREAVKQGFVPMNCLCIGDVFHIEVDEEDSDSQAETKVVLTVLELIDEIEEEAIDSDNEVLLGQIAHFNVRFLRLSSELQLKFEFLAKEDRSKRKLKLLIGKSEEEWEAAIDSMLDEPPKIKTDGVFKKLANSFEKIGVKFAEKLDAEGVEADNLLDGIGSAIRCNTNEVRIRNAENMRARAFKKSFRKAEATKFGWFKYSTYSIAFISLASLAYYITTH